MPSQTWKQRSHTHFQYLIISCYFIIYIDLKKIYGTNPSLGFFGHDVRTGAAFEIPSCQENQNSYLNNKLTCCNISFDFVEVYDACVTYFE